MSSFYYFNLAINSIYNLRKKYCEYKRCVCQQNTRTVQRKRDYSEQAGEYLRYSSDDRLQHIKFQKQKSWDSQYQKAM